MPAFLSAEGIWASYGGLRAVQGVTLEAPEGALVAVLGPNGAGKSTLLRVVAGLHRPERGRVVLDGKLLTGLPAHRVARLGVVLAPEGRAVFPSLSVADNLRIAGIRGRALDQATRAFPVLAKRGGQMAGTLSGGEQQMLALARLSAAEARVLCLDEPSLGLAPRMVDEVFRQIQELRERGTTIVLVEQYVTRALAMADLVYVMEKGRLVFAGEPGELAHHPVLERAYLGDRAEAG